jgi:hypothetical protein
MICSGEGALAHAALEEPLRFWIRYSANGVALRCHVCLHCSTLNDKGFGRARWRRIWGNTGLWGKRGQIKAARRPREPKSCQAERDAGFLSPTSGSSLVAPPPLSPKKMIPNTELACILADESILLGNRVGIHSCSFECPSHQSPS